MNKDTRLHVLAFRQNLLAWSRQAKAAADQVGDPTPNQIKALFASYSDMCAGLAELLRVIRYE